MCGRYSQTRDRMPVIVRSEDEETIASHSILTLRQFAPKPEAVPATTAWYLADLGEAQGKEALFTKQSPQRLRVADGARSTIFEIKERDSWGQT